MACLNCRSYDKDGWCRYHSRNTSATGTCSNEDSNGGNNSYGDRACKNCESFDGNWCRYHKEYTSGNNCCPNFS